MYILQDNSFLKIQPPVQDDVTPPVDEPNKTDHVCKIVSARPGTYDLLRGSYNAKKNYLRSKTENATNYFHKKNSRDTKNDTYTTGNYFAVNVIRNCELGLCCLHYYDSKGSTTTLLHLNRARSCVLVGFRKAGSSCWLIARE